MRIACISYRPWALEIYQALMEKTPHTFMLVRSQEEYNEQALIDFKPDYILYYGWSWKVPAKIIEQFKAIMLHPSPLPKYRGGSPIQNQIIRGEKKTCVTLFRMVEAMDAGEIFAQKEISLAGHLNEIFSRITDVGIELTLQMLDGKCVPKAQDESQATIFKRRGPADSEITMDELKNKDGEYLFNKIRMLEDPYPNAFIRTKDGRKLMIKFAELE